VPAACLTTKPWMRSCLISDAALISSINLQTSSARSSRPSILLKHSLTYLILRWSAQGMTGSTRRPPKEVVQDHYEHIQSGFDVAPR